MGLLRLVAPAGSPLTLAEVKLRLRVDVADDDVGIQRLIDACTRQAEQKTQRSFLTQQWAYIADKFPCGSSAQRQAEQQGFTQYLPYLSSKNARRRDLIVLPLPPLQSVQAIKYIDTAGVQQTLSPSNYVVDNSGLMGVIAPAYGKTWPATQSHPQAVRVEFTCGYGEAIDVEPDIILAILLLIAHYDQNREAVTGRQLIKLPHGVDELLAPYCMPGSF